MFIIINEYLSLLMFIIDEYLLCISVYFIQETLEYQLKYQLAKKSGDEINR